MVISTKVMCVGARGDKKRSDFVSFGSLKVPDTISMFLVVTGHPLLILRISAEIQHRKLADVSVTVFRILAKIFLIKCNTE